MSRYRAAARLAGQGGGTACVRGGDLACGVMLPPVGSWDRWRGPLLGC